MAGKGNVNVNVSVSVLGGTGKSGGSGQNNTNNTTQQNSTYNKQTIERIDSDKVFKVKKDGENDNQISEDSAEYQDPVLDPINMATGKFICEDTDYSLPDTNGDYRLIRRYTTEKDRRNKSLGRAWTFNADTHITFDGDSVTVTMPDAKTAEFIKTGSTYTNKKGGTKKYTLKKQEEGYIFTDSLKNIRYYYDTEGKIKQTKDKNGNTTEYIYGEYGLEKISLSTGYSLTFIWKDMKVSSVTDNTGRTVSYNYERGLLTTVTRCDGTKITYTYDEKENLKTITDSLGNTYLENRYDEKGRVIEQKLAGEACYTFTYDEKTRTNTVTDKENNTSTHYTYDSRKDIILIKYPDGSEIKRETDKYGNLAKCTDRCGAVTTYEHDIKGNLLRSKEPSGLITYYEYENGRNTKVWDNSGRQTTFTYDVKGNITERRTLLDNDTGKENIVTFEYDIYGRIVKTIENDDVITSYGYEGTFPRPCRITAPNGIITIQSYDAAGRLIEKNTEGIKETYTYTEYNKVKTYTDSEGGRTAYYYDAAWRLVKKVSPSQNMTGTIEDAGIIYEYDIMDRLISETDECGRKTEYKRNTNGDVVSIRKCGTKENCIEESIIYSSDINHNLIRKQTGSLGAESYENDACGRVIRKSLYADKDGYIYEMDMAGRITKVKDPYGNITDKYKYDLHGNVICHIHSPKVLKKLAEAEDSRKDTSLYPGDRYTYNAVGQMTTKNELLSIEADGTPLYSITIYVYDDFGQLIVEKTYAEPQSDVEMPQGESRIIRRKYDNRGNLTEITDSTGATATYEYDKYGRMVRETALQDSEKSKVTVYEYDRCGRIINQKIFEKQTEKEQQKPVFKRKAGNRFFESRKVQELPENREILIEETEYGYDKSGNLISAVMPDGLVIAYAYDESGRKISVTASDSKDAAIKRNNTYKYDEYGYLSECTENGITVLYENDAFGNILKEKNADGGITIYNYDAAGKCIRIISPEENRRAGKDAIGTVMEYDLCGRLIKTVSPNGITLEETVYDSSGNILVQKKADGESIRYGYDAGGRMIYSVTAAGVRREYKYDALGNVTAQALGDETAYFENDVWGHMTTLKAAEDITETYEYDKMGSITAAADGEGRRREYHRDIRGNTDRIKYADGSTETFEYDSVGRIVSKTHRSGKKTEYGYDVFGNIVMIKGQDGKDECKYKYKYSADGSLETAEGGGIKYIYEYDVCGRIKAKKACGRTLVSYTYDLNGNKKSVTDATGKSTYYEYDISNRLLRISECDRVLAEYVYTLGGKVSRIVCGDIVTGYEYDADGRYAGIRVSVGENVISDIRYGYDDKGDCIKKANVADGINAVTEYRYDGIGRITGVTGPDISESYTYDRAGNRLSRMTDRGITESYRYNEVNELLSVECSRGDGEVNDIREFTYDADGNMTSDGRGIYKYDDMNRMAEAVMNDGSKFVCRYDAEGLRNETEENGRLVKFIYSGRDAVCEEDEESSIRYIRGNRRLVASDSEQARMYYHYACDSLGSVSHVIAGDEFGSEEENADIGRRVLCRYEYDAFGNTVGVEENVTSRYGFAGEMRDGITGQYYLRARYYMPEIGRFTQADTYHGDGLNLYVYARNNPVKYVDPSGHISKGIDVLSSESGTSSGLPVDENGNIVFYHGTTAEAAASIRKNGVDLDYATRDMDFGRGFYVTTDVNQANTWAERLGDKNNTSGDVVVFEISESDFNKLNNKTFDSPDAEWGKTVVDGRNGVQPPYDTVSGPMLINVKRATKQGAIPKGKGQQTTFLSGKSIDLLNSGMKGKSK